MSLRAASLNREAAKRLEAESRRLQSLYRKQDKLVQEFLALLQKLGGAADDAKDVD